MHLKFPAVNCNGSGPNLLGLATVWLLDAVEQIQGVHFLALNYWPLDGTRALPTVGTRDAALAKSRSKPVGAENAIQVPHAASSYSWMSFLAPAQSMAD